MMPAAPMQIALGFDVHKFKDLALLQEGCICWQLTGLRLLLLGFLSIFYGLSRMHIVNVRR
jgi:hypothetical protein